MAPRRRSPIVPIVVGLVLLLACAGRARADTEAPEVRALGRILASAGVGGRFAEPVCRDGVTLEPARFAEYAEWLRLEQRAPDRPFLLDAGGLLAPHGVARFLADEHPEALARVVRELGYRLLALGESALGAPRGPMLRVLTALRERGIPVVATNLYCDPAERELCDVLVDGMDGLSVHRVGSQRTAFVSLLDPAVLARVGRARAAGLRIADPAHVLEEGVRAARKQDHDLVVAILALDGVPDAAARALELLKSLPADAKPDLVLASGAGDQVLFARPMGFRPAIVGPPPGSAARVRIRRNLITDTFDILAQPVPPSERPHPAITAMIDRWGARYCARWGNQLPGARLERPFAASDMIELAAGAMREATGAEVALLGRRTLDPAWERTDAAALSASDVFIAVRYDEPIVVAEVPGPWLQRLAAATPPGVVTLGVDPSGDASLVNGRPLEPRGTYLVVAARPVTRRDALPSGVEWRTVPEATVRSVLLDYLSEPRPVDPRAGLEDPADDPEWTLRVDMDASFASTAIENPETEPYPDTQLERAETSSFGLRASMHADGVTPVWGWSNHLESRYRITRTVGAETAEGDDQTSLRSTFRWRGLRTRTPLFYVPEPFIETYVETELTTSEDRQFRHFLVRPLAGLQFALTERLRLKLSGGFEVEALAPDPEVLPGAGVQLVLERWELLRHGSRSVALELNADYFASDLFDVVRQTLRGDLKFAVDLLGPLALGVHLDLFLVREGGRSPGIASTASVFLRVAWLGRTVGP